MESPLISVVIPSYNREKTIERSARSVLNQTYKNLELIIVDDCSSDHTKDIVDALAKEDKRVRYIRFDQNKGACAARNAGIDAAKGEYIAFHDSDDEWLPSKLDKQIDTLTKTGAKIIFCKYYMIKDGKNEGVAPKIFNEGFVEKLETVCGIGTQTLIAPRDVFREFHFDERLPRFQDLELMIRMAKKYPLYCMDEPLVNYYIGNSDSISRHTDRALNAIRIIIEKHPDIPYFLPLLGKSFADMLLGRIIIDLKDDGLKRKEIYSLALKSDKSWKTKFWVLSRVLGIYNLGKKTRDKQKRVFHLKEYAIEN